MRAVSRFEADLLHILHAFLGQAPLEQAIPRIVGRTPRPPCLSRGAVALVQDALSKGCVRLLAHQGGWRRERHLRGEAVAEGRLWERTPPRDLGLAFSGHALEFLIGITAEHPGALTTSWQPPPDALTVGDRLLLYFAFDALRATSFIKHLREWPAFADHGPCWLAFPDEFADNRTGDGPDFSPWVAGAGACVLEALQPVLTRRWAALERSKGTITDPSRMRGLGQAQGRALDAFLAAVDAAGRRDLARFLLRAAAEVLHAAARPPSWVGALDLTGLRLAERHELYDTATVFLRRLDLLHHWDQQARTIGYFDDGYAAAQLGKADWDESDGDGLLDRARAIRRELEPI